MSGANAEPDVALRAAREDRDSVVELTRQLVRVPSRAGIDPYGPVLECMSAWLDGHGLRPWQLPAAGGQTVAMVCQITGGRPGPRYVLNACLDTAPFGDEAAWTYTPTSGEIDGGWLHGRGACDSKAGAAIFANAAARLAPVRDQLAGSLVVLSDVDEHTGQFGGARAYFEGADARDSVDGVMIGYPGPDHVVTGGRGVLRARLHVHGVASHSGGRTTIPNAITKATRLVSALADAELPAGAGPDFPLPPRLTVTEVAGGSGYTTIPDLCTLNVGNYLAGLGIQATAGFGVDHQGLRHRRTHPHRLDPAHPGRLPPGMPDPDDLFLTGDGLTVQQWPSAESAFQACRLASAAPADDTSSASLDASRRACITRELSRRRTSMLTQLDDREDHPAMISTRKTAPATEQVRGKIV